MKDVKRTPVPLPDSQEKPTSKPTPSKKPLLSQEFISSGDDDDEHVTSTVVKAAPPEHLKKPKTNIAIHRPKNSEHQKVVAPTAASKSPNTVGSSRDYNDSDSDDDSDSASLESSDDDSDHRDVQSTKRAQSIPAQSYVANSQPIPDFVPPKGFNSVSINDKTTSEAAHMFRSVAGKEIWHITAPAGVPLDVVREITMDSAIKGEVVLDHKGASYSFSKAKASNDEAACAILVPLKDGFKPIARITRTFHLQAVVRLSKLGAKRPGQDTSSEVAASITRSTIRAPRPQLKGLRMRFLPAGSLGVHGDILGDSDDGDDDKLDKPLGQDLPPRIEKRKYAEVNGHEAADLSTKNHKKKHRTPEEKKRKDEKKAKKAAREAAGRRP